MFNIKQKIRHFLIKADVALQEKISCEGVRYIFRNRHSDELVIIFSAIGNVSYNYRRALIKSHRDQLFIKDAWAKGVSYYLYEEGRPYPQEKTSKFIEKWLKKKKYSKIHTVGSSKGGFAALFYGFKYKATNIYAGACQYNLGDYLATLEHKEYYHVTGNAVNDKDTLMLNRALASMIEQNRDAPIHVHLLYSTEEHTYRDHIIDLIDKLDECNIAHTDHVEDFPEHSMVGGPFKHLLMDSL
ncbi:MAG: hypothetical protein J1F13_05500 [Prevotellaceae bacterium]|nr:hypothetical protein [Prevotellaceae bacterium]